MAISEICVANQGDSIESFQMNNVSTNAQVWDGNEDEIELEILLLW